MRSAALAAAEAGGSVLVLEKLPQPGGTTGIAVGSFTAARNSLQQRAGVPPASARIDSAGDDANRVLRVVTSYQPRTRMTESEWRACCDPEPMLEALHGATGDRKLRLFACACCRRVVPLSDDEGLLLAVVASERYAEGLATLEEVLAAWAAADSAIWAFNGVASEQSALTAVQRATQRPAARECARACQDALEMFVQERAWLPWERRSAIWWSGMRASVERAVVDERRVQADLLRCIVGNPIRPVVLDAAWPTPMVVELARAVYDGRVFDGMPVLGDALEEAGCDDVDILTHCRETGLHARGCWVVDLMLGKS